MAIEITRCVTRKYRDGDSRQCIAGSTHRRKVVSLRLDALEAAGLVKSSSRNDKAFYEMTVKGLHYDSPSIFPYDLTAAVRLKILTNRPEKKRLPRKEPGTTDT